MGDKLCMMYHTSKTKEMAQFAVSDSCSKILNGYANIQMLQKLCGSIIYTSLFLIGDYKLIDNQLYTIESICYNVPGLMKLPTHDILEELGNMSVYNVSLIESLKHILHEAMFAEVIDLIGLNTKQVYCALFHMYCKLTEDAHRMKICDQMYLDRNIHIHEIWAFFEKEIIHDGKGLY